ncbi:MAG: DUF4301 family protein [Bacteroidales bacterium]|nr:DUF4301 family protein [Bacteroidales bacterium]
MSDIKLSPKDLKQISSLGLTKQDVLHQISNYKAGFPAVVLDSPATVENKGILRFSKEEEDFYISYYEEHSVNKNILKFVPASGAATRMFKDLYAFTSVYNGIPSTIAKDFPEVKVFLDNINRFAFYDDLKRVMAKTGSSVDDYMSRADYPSVINYLLGRQYLGYGLLPKALLMFHKYEVGARTSLAEHFTEAYRYARSKDSAAYLHFTVSPEHRRKFLNEIRNIRKYYSSFSDIDFHVRLSEQKHYTDIIAVDEYNNPVRNDDGSLIFRPGGHGALIENLGDCKGDIIFIKNIDNVVPDNPLLDKQTITVRYKKLLGGLLLNLQEKVFGMIHTLQQRPSENDLKEIEDYMQKNLCIDLSRELSVSSFEKRVELLIMKLNRPIRVCGMVKNQGEPGGGPFWVVNGDGTKSLQIVETSQINRKNPEQEKILSAATHFNPVDLVCGIRTHSGRYFNLSNYVDHTTGFITKKTVGATIVKSQELPGLWNGAMADWITVFVEVPLQTFNPVKTINDLLRKEHFID